MRNFLGKNTYAFDPDEIHILTEALNETWAIILASGVTFHGGAEQKSIRNAVAKNIVDAAQRGELNKQRLRQGALACFSMMNQRSAPLRSGGETAGASRRAARTRTPDQGAA
jgi:hypothetical protein